MPYPYAPPDFLAQETADVIHKRMLDAMPDDIDKSELQIPWDFTRPAAIEKAEFVQYELNETIKIIFPHWAYGVWLDKHAETVGLKRRDANKAAGFLMVTGKLGMTVFEGFQFATPAHVAPNEVIDGANAASDTPAIAPSVFFEATENVLLNGTSPDQTAEPDGQVTAKVLVRAVEGGASGNVPPDTVFLMLVPDTNITYITNPEAITGGTAIENDDNLRERVLAVLRGGISFTGCDADYIRWSKEVNGVGSVMVDPEWDDPNLPEQFHWIDANGQRRCAGAVRVFVIDANGMPANWQILDAVYDHIVSPNDRINRLAPIGATVTIVAPAPMPIDISAKVVLKPGETLSVVIDRFRTNLNLYWLKAASENSMRDVQAGLAINQVKYVYVGSTLAETAGIHDYDHETLTVNGGDDNLTIVVGTFPVTGAADLYV